jgi:hypothetical protein
MKIRWFFFFFGVFCTLLTNRVEHTLLKFQHCGPCKISWKNSKTSHSDRSDHIEGDVIQNHEQNKKVKNQDYMGKTNYFLRTMSFSPWAVSATWLHVGAP